ncbi:MAG: energy-coupling factor ABC transporter permease [Planctomycetaceae bacterium]|nr:energy-coupling factor ABC transporter permease [Planctomycetaceae bacterium]
MHISDGVLSLPLIAAASLAGAGTLAVSLWQIRPSEISKISLMTCVFFVGSTVVHIPIGPTSQHLMLTGFIGMVLGRKAAIAVTIALLLQLFLFRFGGYGSLAANIFVISYPAMSLGMILRPLLAKHKNMAFVYGFLAGFLAVAGSALLLAGILWESHQRFAFASHMIIILYVPLMFIEGFVTGFALQMIVRIRPNFLFSRDETTA